MDSMHLFRTKDRRYWPKKSGFESNIYPLWLLLEQWGHKGKEIVDGIKESQGFSTDFCHIEKENGFAIIENHQFDDEDEIVRLKIPLENLFDILRKWESLFHSSPQEIILELDGEKVSIRSIA